jgi:hypothetical protein
MILWVRFESDFPPTIHALEIKPARERLVTIGTTMLWTAKYSRASHWAPVNCNTKVALAHNHLFHAVDLLPHVHELTASTALDRHGHHKIDRVFAIFWLSVAWNERGIEIRRIIFVQNLAFTHFRKIWETKDSRL